MAGGFFRPDGKFQGAKRPGAAMFPKESGGLEGLRDPSPLCFDALRRYQVRGAASTVWRSGVEGLLVATAGARGVGACAIGWLAI